MKTILAIILVISLITLIVNLLKSRRRGLPIPIKYGLPVVIGVCVIWLACIRGGSLILAIILMAFAFIGMVFCARYQRAYANAQNLAVGLLLVVLTCMIIILTKTLGSGETRWLIENELKFARSAAVILGRKLAEKYPEAKALIITDENYEKNKRQQQLIEGLKEGFADKITVEAIDYPKPEKPEGMEDEMFFMMHELLTAKDFDDVIDGYPDCNLIVSLIGLPRDVAEMSLWERDEEDRPKVALFFAEHYNLRNAIMADYILVLTYRPGVKFSEDPCPSDPQEAFNKRYLIVDAENVDEIDKKYDNFFSD